MHRPGCTDTIIAAECADRGARRVISTNRTFPLRRDHTIVMPDSDRGGLSSSKSLMWETSPYSSRSALQGADCPARFFPALVSYAPLGHSSACRRNDFSLLSPCPPGSFALG